MRQVHGAAVVRVRTPVRAQPREADALVSDAPGVAVGVVTADCVPVLAATERGDAVCAVHVGWRGLARGVVRAALDELGRIGADVTRAAAVVGPHVGPCCYEVDEPVLDALVTHLYEGLGWALRPARPDHWTLDLGYLVRLELLHAGLAADRVAAVPSACTACDPRRFLSYRRDGPGAGRMVHFVAAVRGGLDTASGSP